MMNLCAKWGRTISRRIHETTPPSPSLACQIRYGFLARSYSNQSPSLCEYNYKLQQQTMSLKRTDLLCSLGSLFQTTELKFVSTFGFKKDRKKSTHFAMLKEVIVHKDPRSSCRSSGNLDNDNSNEHMPAYSQRQLNLIPLVNELTNGSFHHSAAIQNYNDSSISDGRNLGLVTHTPASK